MSDQAEPRAELAATATTLARKVDRLSDSIDGLRRRTARSERVLVLTVTGLILDLALTVLAAFLVYGQYNTARQLSATQDQVLCPLYNLILQGQNPRARAAYPAGPDAYDRGFEVIKQGYAVLHCTPNPP